MTRKLAQLVLACFLLWLVLAGPAWMLWGSVALLYSGVACLLCLVPMAATLAWCGLSLNQTPEKAVLAVLGGTGLRMALVMVGAVVLYLNVETLHQPAFLFWVIAFYLATLTLEVGMVLAGISASSNSKQS